MPSRGPLRGVGTPKGAAGRSGRFQRAVAAFHASWVMRVSIASGTNWVTGRMLMVASGLVS